MTMNEARRVLHQMFWSRLDQKDRIDVLVSAGLMPQPIVSRLPHTIERMFLESANDRENLSRLWAEVTRRMPEELRKPNPFEA